MDRIVKRHELVWRIVYAIMHPLVRFKFNLKHDVCNVEGPCIVISNHVTNWDPLLVATCFPKKQMYFVASEHLFRKGFLSKALCYLQDPIPRKKGAAAADTVKNCLRRMKAGRSVGLFAEGDTTWNGRTAKISDNTGKLARRSGATLITVRIEGAYLANPRWGKGVRRGKVYVHPVNIYTPDQLKAMTVQEVTAAINNDIYEDAWQRQLQWKIPYKGKDRAKNMESALFLCPQCRKTGGLIGEGDWIKCSCGLKLYFAETGQFEPAQPFDNLVQWDSWQFEQLENRNFDFEGNILFSDDNIKLIKIMQDHRQEEIFTGSLYQYEDYILCGEKKLAMDEISMMGLVRTNMLLLTVNDEYYQIRANGNANLRKYMAIWREKKGG